MAGRRRQDGDGRKNVVWGKRATQPALRSRRGAFRRGTCSAKGHGSKDLSPAVPSLPAPLARLRRGGSGALPPAAPAGRQWARSRCGEFTRCRGNPRRQSRAQWQSTATAAKVTLPGARLRRCEDGAGEVRVEVEGTAGPWGPRDTEPLSRGRCCSGTIRAGCSLSGAAAVHPGVCREWYGRGSPGTGTASPTQPFSQHKPYWPGNTGMENWVMLSSEEKSCLHFLK